MRGTRDKEMAVRMMMKMMILDISRPVSRKGRIRTKQVIKLQALTSLTHCSIRSSLKGGRRIGMK